jgi:hypothetical protein
LFGLYASFGALDGARGSRVELFGLYASFGALDGARGSRVELFGLYASFGALDGARGSSVDFFGVVGSLATTHFSSLPTEPRNQLSRSARRVRLTDPRGRPECAPFGPPHGRVRGPNGAQPPSPCCPSPLPQGNTALLVEPAVSQIKKLLERGAVVRE